MAMTTFLWIVFIIFLLFALYTGYALYIYRRVQPAERACVNCAAPASVDGYSLYYREVGLDQGLPTGYSGARRTRAFKPELQE